MFHSDSAYTLLKHKCLLAENCLALYMQELVEQCSFVLMCAYMTHPYLQHRLIFLDYGFVISVAALDILMERYYFPYLICGMATFPLKGRSCPFILAWNRMKSIMCKPKLKQWMGKMQVKLTCGSTKFCDCFSALWWEIITLTAVALNWDSKFVISFLEWVNGSFLLR